MTPEILIARLELVAAAFPTAAALAVQFPDYVEFVRAGEADKVAKLERLTEAGGQVIGFVYVQREGRQVEICAQPLAELEDEPGIQEDLQSVVEYFRALLVDDGRCAPTRSH